MSSFNFPIKSMLIKILISNIEWSLSSGMSHIPLHCVFVSFFIHWLYITLTNIQSLGIILSKDRFRFSIGVNGRKILVAGICFDENGVSNWLNHRLGITHILLFVHHLLLKLSFNCDFESLFCKLLFLLNTHIFNRRRKAFLKFSRVVTL